MKLKIFNVGIMLLCILMLAGCTPSGLSFDAIKSNDLASTLNEINTLASSLKYPQQVTYDQVIPKTWYMECNHPVENPSALSCFLGIPLERPYQVTTVNLPCGTKYGRFIVQSRDFDGMDIAWGDKSYMRATHHYCYVKSPPVFPAQIKDYRINQAIADMDALNPYTAKSEYQRALADNFTAAAIVLQGKVATLESDAASAIAWMDYLEKSVFLPNVGMWDKQSEVAAYKQSMTEIREQASKVKVLADKLAAWKF